MQPARIGGFRYSEHEQCALHLTMQMEAGANSFYLTAAWSLAFCSKDQKGAMTPGGHTGHTEGLIQMNISLLSCSCSKITLSVLCSLCSLFLFQQDVNAQ